MPVSTGVRLPLRRLQGAQEVTMFSQLARAAAAARDHVVDGQVRCPVPQYWQVQESRAKTARRVIRRRRLSRGTRT